MGGKSGRLPFMLPRTVLYGPRRPFSTRVLWRLRGPDLVGVYLYNVRSILLLLLFPIWCSSYYISTPHWEQSGRLPFFLPRTALPAPQSRPNASVLGGLRSGGARTRWPFAGHWAIAQMGGVKTASRGGLRSRIRAPREMAPFAMRSAKAATRDGRLPGTRPARWPFARHPANSEGRRPPGFGQVPRTWPKPGGRRPSELAGCQANGHLAGRVPGKRPSRWPPWPNAWQTAISRGARIRERSPPREAVLTPFVCAPAQCPANGHLSRWPNARRTAISFARPAASVGPSCVAVTRVSRLFS